MRGGIETSAFGFGPARLAAPPPSVRRAGSDATESWTVTATDVDAWVKTAQPGERFVYCHGPQLVQGSAAARVGQLTDTGDVIPHHKRTADGGFDFVIVRNRVRVVESRRAPVCDPPMLAVLVVVQDAAANGERCPSNAAIGEATQMTAGQVKWHLKKLEDAKFIGVAHVPCATDARFRVVTVTATGCQTAGPAA